MAPIKFEDNVKEKLENRTLKPSNEAWTRLAKRLDEHQSVKGTNSKTFWWIGIAASIIGVVFVVSQFFNTPSIIPEVVVTPNTQKEQQNIEILSDKNKIKTEIIAIEEPTQIIKETISTKNAGIDEAVIPDVSINESIAINTNIYKEQNLIVEDPKEIINHSFEESKVEDVVAKVQDLKDNNLDVTNETIEALLMEAQKEIQLNKLINETTGTVDANLLLQDVEAEVDQSFRSKVFEALRNSYNTVKTAVAQRND